MLIDRPGPVPGPGLRPESRRQITVLFSEVLRLMRKFERDDAVATAPEVLLLGKLVSSPTPRPADVDLKTWPGWRSCEAAGRFGHAADLGKKESGQRQSCHFQRTCPDEPHIECRSSIG